MTSVQLCTWKQNVPINPYKDLVEKCLVPVIHLALFRILDAKNKKQTKQNNHDSCVAYILAGETENKYKQEVMQSILDTYKCFAGK